MEGLLNKSGITKLRGHCHTYRGTPLMPTYHPAYLLRNQADAREAPASGKTCCKYGETWKQITRKRGIFFLQG